MTEPRYKTATRKRIKELVRKRTHDLRERVKELGCLFEISKLVQRPDISLEEILQGTVDLIPPGWQYPEVTCARIVFEGHEFRTENFRETAWRQTSDLIVNGERIGAVEVCYLQEKPQRDEGPFLEEERRLLNAIAERLGRLAERTRAEEALRANEKRYRHIFESIRDIFYRTDAQGIITEISPSVKRWGYTREQLIGTQVKEVYEGPEQRSALLKAIMEGEDLTDYEIRLKTGDGRVVDISVSAHMLRGPDGVFAGTEGTLRDISRRKQAEEALRSRAAELEDLNRQLVHAHDQLSKSRTQLAEKSALLQSVAEAQVVSSSGSFEVTAGKVLGRLAALVPADLFALAVVAEGKPLLLTFSAARPRWQLADEIRRQLSEAAELVLDRKLPGTLSIAFEPITGGSAKLEAIRSHVVLPLTSPDLDRPLIGGMFSGQADAFTDDDVVLFTAVGVSLASFYLTRLVRAEEEDLKRRQSEFVATVSHEIRTPLHSIWGFVRLLLEEKVEDEETRREFLGILDRECAQLAALVSDFLDVSKIEAGKMEMRVRPFAVDELVARAVVQSSTAAEEKGIPIETDLPPELPAVQGDEERLGQVLVNLLNNALKFSEAGGMVAIGARVEGPELVVSVQDQGIGMPKKDQPQVFERFYQADSSGTRPRGGTGLGLYISRQIVEAHGGRIWVESRVGRGSTFSFAIPIAAEATEGVETDEAA